MTLFFKKIAAVSIFLLGLLSVTSVGLAQTQTNPVSVVDGPAISVSILNSSVSTSTGTINLDYSIKNNQSDFIDNLNYRLEIYRGDKLAIDGDLFSPLEYVSNKTGPVSKIAPFEEIKGQVSYKPSAGIKSGNYFIRFVAFDREYKKVDLDYTKSPISLKGSGYFLGNIQAVFRTSLGDDFLMAGQLIDKTETPSIVVFLADNANLKAALDKGLKLSSEIKVLSLANEKIVHEYPAKSLSVSSDKDGKKILKIDLVPWTGITPSPYQVEVIFKDSNGNVVANKLIAKWWVKGFVGRISDVKTQTNFYKQNQSLDLAVSLISFDWSSQQKGIVEARLEKSTGGIISFSKDFDFAENVTVDFSDKKISEETMIKSVELVYKDKISGEIVDTRKVEMSQDKVYVAPESSSKTIYLICLVLLMLAVILFLLSFKKTRKVYLILSLVFLVVTIVLLLLGSNLNKALADKSNSTAVIWFTTAPEGNQGTCPQSPSVIAKGRVTCPTCMNGMLYQINVAGQVWNVGDKGHIYENNVFGPYTTNVTLSNSTPVSYKASLLATAGAHCSASYAETLTKTVSCTAPVNNNKPTGLTYSCPTPGTSGTVSWNAVSGASAYALRVDNKASSWNGACDGAQNSGDVCLNKTTNSHTFTSVSGATYSWWVHSIVNGVMSEASYGADFTCPTPVAATCTVSPGTASKNQNVTWTAHPTGGTGTYTYSWNGDASGSNATSVVTYNTTGTKNATVSVTSGGQTVTSASCTNSVVSGGGGNGSGSTGIVITDSKIDGACVSGGSYSSAPTDPYLCLTGTASSVTGNGPWTWNCIGSGTGHTDAYGCSATKSQDPVSTVSCKIDLTTNVNANNEVPVNTNTTWQVLDLNDNPLSNTYTRHWSYQEGSNPEFKSAGSDLVLNKIFTTTGTKTIKVSVSYQSGTPLQSYTSDCSVDNSTATINIVSAGSTTEN